MSVQVKIFGVLVDATGQTEISFENIGDTDVLQKLLKAKYPLLNNHRFTLAVNLKVVRGNNPLQDGDEVALLPPYSGG